LTTSLFSLSLPAIDIEAVKNLVNHQYIFKASPWSLLRATERVPNIVRAAARVVMSSLSQVLKKVLRNEKPNLRRTSWMLGTAPLVTPGRGSCGIPLWFMAAFLPVAFSWRKRWMWGVVII
jgi:hypothetical protein